MSSPMGLHCAPCTSGGRRALKRLGSPRGFVGAGPMWAAARRVEALERPAKDSDEHGPKAARGAKKFEGLPGSLSPVERCLPGTRPALEAAHRRRLRRRAVRSRDEVEQEPKRRPERLRVSWLVHESRRVRPGRRRSCWMQGVLALQSRLPRNRGPDDSPRRVHQRWVHSRGGRSPEGRFPEGRSSEGRFPGGRSPEGRFPEGRSSEGPRGGAAAISRPSGSWTTTSPAP